MGIYNELISQAKADEKQKTGKPETRQARKPASRNSVKQKAGQSEQRLHVRQKAVKRKHGKRDTVHWADAPSLVTVGTKAPEDVAQHWAVEAKKRRVSMSFIITTALIEAFGLPEGARLVEEE